MLKRLWLALVFVVASAGTASAAGTITETVDDDAGNGLRVITLTATADASDASYPAVATLAQIDGALCRVVVDPSGTATPTDNYDATLTDKWGIDIMEGTLSNLDTTSTVAVDFVPTVNAGAATGCAVVRGPLTLTLTGNSENDAVTVFHLLVIRGK